MNRARQNLFAGSALACQQDGGIRRRNPADLLAHALHRGAFSNDDIEFALCGNGLAEFIALGFDLGIFQGAFDRQNQLIHLEWLG